MLETGARVSRVVADVAIFVLMGVTTVGKTLHAGFTIDVDPVLARLGVKVLAPILVESAAGTAKAGSHDKVRKTNPENGELKIEKNVEKIKYEVQDEESRSGLKKDRKATTRW